MDDLENVLREAYYRNLIEDVSTDLTSSSFGTKLIIDFPKGTPPDIAAAVENIIRKKYKRHTERDYSPDGNLRILIHMFETPR